MQERPSIEAPVGELDPAERGFVLGCLLSGGERAHDAARVVAPPSRERCTAAVIAIAALPRADRIRLLSRLAREALVPIPPGIETVHPDTLREVLRAESTETIRLIATDAPTAVQVACADALEARGAEEAASAPRPSSAAAPDVVAELQRAVLGSIVAIPTQVAGARPRRWASALANLPPEQILAEVTGIGADILGTSLRGADEATLRRAAAHVDTPWSQRILDRARAREEDATVGGAIRVTRSEARELVVATTPADDPLATLTRLGARALDDHLGREDPELAVAVAQRLPAALQAHMRTRLK